MEREELETLMKKYGNNVARPYQVKKVLWIKNGCCHDLPVLLTSNQLPDRKINYSCQCACGGWCTTGRRTPNHAINDYRRMTAGEILYL